MYLKRKHQSVMKVFGPDEMCSTEQVQQDPPVASDFPGTVRHVIAQEALDHLKRNFATFEKIFEDFHIQKSDYRLLAGFDEDVIRGHLWFLNQIHVFLLSEPPDITSFLTRLSPALEGFSALVFTDKSTYHIPSSNITRRATYETARELPCCVSTLSQNVENVSLTVGGQSGQSGQGSNGMDGSRRKGKEREDTGHNAPDSGNGADGDADPEPPGPDITQNAEITFRVVSHLHQYGQAREQGARRGEPFQKLQVHGTVKTKRTSESQDPRRFPICVTEFTDLRTMFNSKPEKPTYRHIQLGVDIDAKERYTLITEIQPVSTSKYNPESKVSHTSKKACNMQASASVNVVQPQGTIGASGSRTGEQATATEKTTRVSRIIQRDIGPNISWSFHIADPFDQETGLTLSPEKLPRARFEFLAKTPAPPPDRLPLAISTCWSLLSPHGGGVWLTPEDTPSFSNLCKIITLDIPSNLQGPHKYLADLLVWPKHSNLGTTVTRPEGEFEEGVGGLVKAKVIDTDRVINTST